MNLITGGFRTITGSIGKGDKSAYTVNTPAASIGIRGTNYEIAQEKSGEFVIAVWDGGITVTNDQGSMNVGSNSEFNFARITSDEEPKGLEEQPEALTDTSVASTDSQQEPNDENVEDDSNDAESNEKTEKSPEEENSEDKNKDDAEVAEIPTASEEAPETVDAAAASEGSAQESELGQEVAKAEEAASNVTEEPFPELVTVTSVDTRFNDTEYTYLLKRPRAGLLVNVESNQTGTIQNALIVQDDTVASANPVVSLPGSNPGSELNLDSFPLNVTSTSNTQFNLAVQNSEYVSWGRWNGNVDISSGPNDTNPTSTAKNFYWLSAEAANLSSLRGEVSFSGSEGIGDINGAAISSLSGKFDVNFANGAIENGNLNFENTDQAWTVNFTGSVTGVNATMSNLQGDVLGNSSCLDCVSGDIQGIFARPGDHFVGGFTLESTNSSTANGLFSLKQSP